MSLPCSFQVSRLIPFSYPLPRTSLSPTFPTSTPLIPSLYSPETTQPTTTSVTGDLADHHCCTPFNLPNKLRPPSSLHFAQHHPFSHRKIATTTCSRRSTAKPTPHNLSFFSEPNPTPDLQNLAFAEKNELCRKGLHSRCMSPEFTPTTTIAIPSKIRPIPN